mmetsp:Transcript_67402/g.217640  ORF Transcript_67402/g.217640 Transcript_67402/m.217640 type:complete len:283 (-) Transcript_67402:302-1150(-)
MGRNGAWSAPTRCSRAVAVQWGARGPAARHLRLGMQLLARFRFQATGTSRCCPSCGSGMMSRTTTQPLQARRGALQHMHHKHPRLLRGATPRSDVGLMTARGLLNPATQGKSLLLQVWIHARHQHPCRVGAPRHHHRVGQGSRLIPRSLQQTAPRWQWRRHPHLPAVFARMSMMPPGLEAQWHRRRHRLHWQPRRRPCSPRSLLLRWRLQRPRRRPLYQSQRQWKRQPAQWPGHLLRTRRGPPASQRPPRRRCKAGCRTRKRIRNGRRLPTSWTRQAPCCRS